MKKKKQEFDPIFKSGEDWRYNACLNCSNDQLEVYTIGYKEAADRLVKSVVENRYMLDALIYPICFLYRQYIELRLKEIIRSGRTLLENGAGFPQHHKLQPLYLTAKEIIKKAFSEEEHPPDLSLVDHIIAEFSEIDPESISFRYPFDKSGRNLLEKITHINLKHLSENIDQFGEHIDTISFVISVYLDHKREFNNF
jgi:hypothetical protein